MLKVQFMEDGLPGQTGLPAQQNVEMELEQFIGLAVIRHLNMEEIIAQTKTLSLNIAN